MGSAIGKSLIELIGCRVGGDVDLVLPYFDSTGKFVDAKAVVSVYINGKRRRDGSEGRRDLFRVTMWGSLAWTAALSCSPGKELNVWGEPRMFKGRAYDENGNLINWNNGPLMINKFGVTLTDIRFGDDSANQIAKEIQTYLANPNDLGGRPQQWNVPGSQDQQIWKARIKQRLDLQYDGQSQRFGFARVIMPQAQGCRVLSAQEIHTLRTQGRRAITGGTAPAAPAQSGPVYQQPAPATPTGGFGAPAPANAQPAPQNAAATPGNVAMAFGAPAAPQNQQVPTGGGPAFTAPNAAPQAGNANLGF
jgi:hypothetical protein